MRITVIIPTHNPDLGRLKATLCGLQAQTLEKEQWELIIVDNGSSPALSEEFCQAHFTRQYRIICEPELGLSNARLRGIKESQTELLVFSDDDNVLAPDYLKLTLTQFELHAQIGIAGGKSIPAYEEALPGWFVEGMAPLGCRDLGDEDIVFDADCYKKEPSYPECAPIGAGMAFRKQAVKTWMENVGETGISDRKGDSLSSAGDCDMVLYALDAGWSAAYWPELSLQHLIPPQRVTRKYLGRISRCAYSDFIQVLSLHRIEPWSSIPAWSVPLRTIKAWFQTRAWKGPQEHVRWQCATGNFEGRSKLHKKLP